MNCPYNNALTSHPHPYPLPSRERGIGESIGGTLSFLPPPPRKRLIGQNYLSMTISQNDNTFP